MDEELKKIRRDVTSLQREEKDKLEEEKKTAIDKIRNEVSQKEAF